MVKRKRSTWSPAEKLYNDGQNAKANKLKPVMTKLPSVKMKLSPVALKLPSVKGSLGKKR